MTCYVVSNAMVWGAGRVADAPCGGREVSAGKRVSQKCRLHMERCGFESRRVLVVKRMIISVYEADVAGSNPAGDTNDALRPSY